MRILRIATLCLSAVTLALTAANSRAAEFVYQSPGGVSFRVTEAGLSSIHAGDREIASGGWSAFDAEYWFKPDAERAVKSEPAGARTLETIDDHHARVRQTGGDLVCIYDYTFDGEDVVISSRIENNNQKSPINVVGFAGLRFHFDSLPDGLMPVQNISYFVAHGLSACHPGFWQAIGGTYATDNSIGIGTSPWNGGLVQTLTLWDFADWNPGKRENVPERDLRYFVASLVPSRGAATFDFAIRVSRDRDWKHLLGKYRDYFAQVYGPARYKIDGRFIGTDYLNGGKDAISRQNPYGFRADHRRLDTPIGALTFCNTTIGPLKQAGAQGMILWGLSGENPRGVMYRPDFDAMPPNVDYNFATIVQRYKAAGLKLGVATRPRDVVTPLDWTTDTAININPDEDSNRNMIWRRFSNMIDKGCTLFYLDSFGNSFEDVKLMQFLREKLGPGILTFCEHQSDAILPFTGGYSETTFTGGEKGKPGSYELWTGNQNWEIFKWLCPGSQMVGRLYETKNGKPGPADVGPDEWFYSHDVTPLIPFDNFGDRLWGARAAEAKYLDSNWRFKPAQ